MGKQWNEKQIEDLLSQMPKVEDKQSEKYLYNQIEQKMAKGNKKSWVFPGIASVAAVLIIIVVSFSFMQQQSNHISSESGRIKKEEAGESPLDTKEKPVESLMNKENISPSLLGKEDEHFVTIAVPDEQGEIVIPLTYTEVDKEESLTESITKLSKSIDEEEFGLSDNQLKNFSLSSTEDTVSVIIPPSYTTQLGSTGEVIFQKSLEETFRWLPVDYKRIEFYTGEQQGIILGNMGEMYEKEINPHMQKGYLLYQLNESKPLLLVPTLDSYESLNAAIEAMKQNHTKGAVELKAPINEDGSVSIQSVIPSGEKVTIEFGSESKIEDDKSSLYMLHALMLTAREFGYKEVEFTGIDAKQVGDIDIGKALPVPLAPNVIHRQ